MPETDLKFFSCFPPKCCRHKATEQAKGSIANLHNYEHTPRKEEEKNVHTTACLGILLLKASKIAGALRSLYFHGRRIQDYLFWKWLLPVQWFDKNEVSDMRFKYLMNLANDQADRSVFGGLGSFGTAVAGAVPLTFAQKIQDPIAELEEGPQHSICILM